MNWLGLLAALPLLLFFVSRFWMSRTKRKISQE
jgi:hypothetical protein